MDIDERGDLAIDHEVKTFVLSLVSAVCPSSVRQGEGIDIRSLVDRVLPTTDAMFWETTRLPS